MSYASFEKLEIWQRACRLAVAVYKALKGCRDYAMKDQMTRAAISIASNIAEGAERGTPKEFIRFFAHCKRVGSRIANSSIHCLSYR
jgi:four helix bundle protein